MTPDHAGTLIVVTGDKDQFPWARRKAMDVAHAGGQIMILYDWDAPTLFGDPLPTWWSGEGSESQFSRRLDQTQLRAAGRAAIADQVADAEALGIRAFGWLPSDHGPAALATYAQEQGALTVVISAALEDLTGLDALLNGNRPAEALDAQTPATVIVVDEASPKPETPR